MNLYMHGKTHTQKWLIEYSHNLTFNILRTLNFKLLVYFS